MKKMMFVAVAALMMCIGFNACGSRSTSPGQKVIEGLEEVLDFCKNYQVESVDDAIMFDQRFSAFEAEIDERYGDLDNLKEDDLTEEEMNRVNALNSDIQAELNRILREVAELSEEDIDLSDLEGIGIEGLFGDDDDDDLDIDLDDIEDALEDVVDDISDII